MRRRSPLASYLPLGLAAACSAAGAADFRPARAGSPGAEAASSPPAELALEATFLWSRRSSVPRRPQPDALLKGIDLGASLAYLGDVDADGVGDWAIGAPSGGFFDLKGSVLAVSGADGRTLWEDRRSCSDDFEQEAGRWMFLRFSPCYGNHVLAMGDLDGDGVCDVAASDSPVTADGTGSLRVVFLSGCSGEVLWTWDTEAQEGIGASVGPLGDIDGDGVTELAATAGVWFSIAEVELFSPGRRAVIGKVIDPGAGRHSEEPPSAAGSIGKFFGSAVGGIGDVDGDGVSDLGLVGAVGEHSSQRLYVFSGRTRDMLFDLVPGWPGEIIWGASFATAERRSQPGSLLLIGLLREIEPREVEGRRAWGRSVAEIWTADLKARTATLFKRLGEVTGGSSIRLRTVPAMAGDGREILLCLWGSEAERTRLAAFDLESGRSIPIDDPPSFASMGRLALEVSPERRANGATYVDLLVGTSTGHRYEGQVRAFRLSAK